MTTLDTPYTRVLAEWKRVTAHQTEARLKGQAKGWTHTDFQQDPSWLYTMGKAHGLLDAMGMFTTKERGEAQP
jgi:hypothetical protein